MLIEIAAPVGALGLVDGRSLPEGVRLDFERTASVAGGDSTSLVVSGDGAGALIRAMRDRRAVGDVTVVSDGDGETVCRLRWDPPGVLQRVRENGGTVLSAVARDDAWTFELRFPERDAASRFYAQHDGDAEQITVRRVTEQEVRRRPRDRLTAEQRDALSRAVATGYFEVPRRTTLADIARELDVSDTAVSERLRRGVTTVLRDSRLALREVGDPVRRGGETDRHGDGPR